MENHYLTLIAKSTINIYKWVIFNSKLFKLRHNFSNYFCKVAEAPLAASCFSSDERTWTRAMESRLHARFRPSISTLVAAIVGTMHEQTYEYPEGSLK